MTGDYDEGYDAGRASNDDEIDRLNRRLTRAITALKAIAERRGMGCHSPREITLRELAEHALLDIEKL